MPQVHRSFTTFFNKHKNSRWEPGMVYNDTADVSSLLGSHAVKMVGWGETREAGYSRG